MVCPGYFFWVLFDLFTIFDRGGKGCPLCGGGEWDGAGGGGMLSVLRGKWKNCEEGCEGIGMWDAAGIVEGIGWARMFVYMHARTLVVRQSISRPLYLCLYLYIYIYI